MGQLRRGTRGTESARECAVARQQRDGGAAGGEMQSDVDTGEPRTDHQDVVGPPRTEGIQRAGRPRIQYDSAVSTFGQHRGEGAFQRVGHATWRAAGCQHRRVGQQLTTIVERQPNRGAGRQLHHLGGLDSHVGLDELVLQVTAVGQSGREAFGWGDGSLVEPAGEVIGIVRPGRHPRRGNIQQMCRVVGAVGRAGAGTPRGVDQGDLRVRLVAAQMHGGEHARGPTTDDRDAHHHERLSRRRVAAPGPVTGRPGRRVRRRRAPAVLPAARCRAFARGWMPAPPGRRNRRGRPAASCPQSRTSGLRAPSPET